MPKCKGCGKYFKQSEIIDGKRKTLNSRRYCLECKPYIEKTITCKKCGKEFPKVEFVNGERRDYRKRECCLECRPPLQKTTITCKNCGKEFPKTEMVDGKRRYYHTREYCFECNPAGERKFWGGEEANKTKYDENGKRLLVDKEIVCKTCGKIYYQKSRNAECSTCRSKKQRFEKKSKAIKYLGGKCEICGYDACEKAFDFHHIDPEDKDFNLCNQWSCRSWEEIKKELDKCILLCATHHREYHADFFCFLTDKDRYYRDEETGEWKKKETWVGKVERRTKDKKDEENS